MVAAPAVMAAKNSARRLDSQNCSGLAPLSALPAVPSWLWTIARNRCDVAASEEDGTCNQPKPRLKTAENHYLGQNANLNQDGLSQNGYGKSTRVIIVPPKACAIDANADSARTTPDDDLRNRGDVCKFPREAFQIDWSGTCHSHHSNDLPYSF